MPDLYMQCLHSWPEGREVIGLFGGKFAIFLAQCRRKTFFFLVGDENSEMLCMEVWCTASGAVFCLNL
jgi:hypothetical protein